MKISSALRSRRVAVTLLVSVTTYSWLGTLVPQESYDAAAAKAWHASHPALSVVVHALGLDRAYSHPIFVAAILVLAVSTAACARERTRASVRAFEAQRKTSTAAWERLVAHSETVIRVPGGWSLDSAMEVASRTMNRQKLRVHHAVEGLQGTRGTFGLVGSPLFHWALFALIVVVAAGRMTRYEGITDVVIGNAFEDVPGSYRTLSRGPLVPDASFTRSLVSAVELDPDYEEDFGVRGVATRIRVNDPSGGTSEQWVYPNRPLTTGSLSILSTRSGPALVGRLVPPESSAEETVVLFFDYTDRSPRRFDYADSAGTEWSVDITPVGGRRVEVSVPGDSARGPQTIGIGESATLADGTNFTVDDLSFFAQIQLTNDWSVPWIYALFTLGTLGATLTTFVLPRTVRIVAVEDDAGLRLHVAVKCRANDPAFKGRVVRALEAALAGDSETDDHPPQRAGDV